MLEIAEVNEFLEGKFIEIRKQFWSNNTASFTVIADDIKKETTNHFSDLFKNVGKTLKKNKQKVALITVSVLRQSVWNEKQRAIIEVYDEFHVSKKPIYSEEMDVSWLFLNWSRFHQELTNEIKNQGLANVIKEPYVCWMMEKTIKDLIVIFASFMRQILLDADDFEHFDELSYLEGFRISVGEYMDWQNVVFAIPTSLPIENEDLSELMYQRVENKNYGGVRFQNKDFTAAKFINCTFQNCEFDNVIFQEARFVNCTLRNIVMRNGSLVKAGFIQSSLVNVDCSTMNMNHTYQNDCLLEHVNVGSQSEE